MNDITAEKAGSTPLILKGILIWNETPTELAILAPGYLVAKQGRILGVYETLPATYTSCTVTDYGDKLIVPGLTDLHVHAPQYGMRGMGMDAELLDWLNTYTFPEECKYQDMVYATRAYQQFISALVNGATTRAVIFATRHVPATLFLMEKLEETGLRTMVGKVNMDRNSPDTLCETTEESLRETERWLSACQAWTRTRPILTPRFTPTCTEALLEGLGNLQRTNQVPVQSHLSENEAEIQWVRALCPDAQDYGETYERHGLLGGNAPTVMAHCVHSVPTEVARIKRNGVWVAHCPQSNTNLASGIAPIGAYLEEGLRVGLGTDVAGGSSLSMLRTMCDAVQVSKLRWRLLDSSHAPLTVPQVLYMATVGGGSFFGKVGLFQEGYELDAVVLDDTALTHPQELSPAERLERLIYLGDERQVFAKYVSGVRVK